MRERVLALGLLLGDPGGIGPEVGAKLVAQHADDRVRLEVLGTPEVWARGMAQAGVPGPAWPDQQPLTNGEAGSGRLVFRPLAGWAEELPAVGQTSVSAGRYCLQSLRAAVTLVQQGQWQGFVYAPMNKASLQLGGSPHPDDIGLLSALFGLEQPGSEINVLDELCTARVTSHIPLADVARQITAPGVLAAMQRLDFVLATLDTACRDIAVAGLNPHAGDNGLFGDEEAEILEPAIALAKAQGLSVTGPVSPDTVFVRARRGEFGGVVTMYHDQGQIAMKLLGFERGVTLAAGLPVPVTTTAHGTAFDITGTGKANPGSLVRALEICIAQILKREEIGHVA